MTSVNAVHWKNVEPAMLTRAGRLTERNELQWANANASVEVAEGKLAFDIVVNAVQYENAPLGIIDIEGRLTSVNAVQLVNAPVPIIDTNGKSTLLNAEQYENAYPPMYDTNGKLIVAKDVQRANACEYIYVADGKLISVSAVQ